MAVSRSDRKFSWINGRPILKANHVATITYRNTTNTMARGMSMPPIDKGPDKPHRMPVNATSDTTALSAPMASVRDPVTNIAMSCSMR
ncbi:hypothetical protein D3C87_1509370 [compost metagenome]